MRGTAKNVLKFFFDNLFNKPFNVERVKSYEALGQLTRIRNDPQGSVSPTYLPTAFMPVDPKSIRIQSSCQYLFTLLGSSVAKAARRTLMKLTPCCNYMGWPI